MHIQCNEALINKIMLCCTSHEIVNSARRERANKNVNSNTVQTNFVFISVAYLFSFNFLFIEHIEEDDSDMLMEPDEFRATALLPPHATAGYFQSGEFRSGEFRSGEYRTLAPEYVHLERPVPQRVRSIEDTRSPPQNIFPSSFFRNGPPLGHSRPYFASQEMNGRYSGGRSFDQSILGSGDFGMSYMSMSKCFVTLSKFPFAYDLFLFKGVIRGGTFYQDDDPPVRSSYESDEFLNYFNTNNGHGRPHSAFVPKTFYPEEQFSNFRDFADINTPTDPAYSQFVVVYANKNSTAVNLNPKNIIEQLQLLDTEEQRKEKKNSISKFKKKLANTKLEKKYKKKVGTKDNNADIEPLLALS